MAEIDQKEKRADARILARPPTPTLPFPRQAVHYLPLTITALIDLPTCLPIDVTPVHLLDDLSFSFFSSTIKCFDQSDIINFTLTIINICQHV